MRKITALAAAALIGMFAVNAHAGFYIEPYLGYEFGESEDPSGTDDHAGTMMGARIGWAKLGFAVGLDYQTGSVEVDDTPKYDVDISDLGLFVGYDFPVIPLRVYGTYFFDSKAEPDITGASELSGSGMRFGVGFTGLPIVNINLEKIMRDYDEMDGASGDPEIEIDAMMLSVSADFTF